MKNYKIPTLTIAGSDSSGGAGIQADLKTFSAIGTYGMSVITAITAQNTEGVFDVEELSSKIIKSQIKVVCEDIMPKAIKIGMVSSPEIIKDIVDALEEFPCEYLIVDPVMISKSGYSLLRPEAKENLKKYLIPKAYIVTPNIPEAEEITNMKIETVEDMKKAGELILNLGPKYVLMKGGHLNGDCIDILMGKDLFEVFEGERIDRKNTHGTGCTISSAITSHLALGYDIKEAVKLSKEYITEAIRHSFDIGKGVGPVHHFYREDNYNRGDINMIKIFDLVEKVKALNPLVLHYTNNVTITDCANTTLAIGASPLMSFSYEEVEDIVSVSSSVVINIGTMNSELLDLFVLAGKAANKYNKPVILDPVGVFATKARTELTNKLLNEVKFDVIRGNISEIQFLGGLDVNGKGVDSFDDGSDSTEIVEAVARKLECVVVASGKTDIISDVKTTYKIENGSEKLKLITGTGCMSTSLIGSFLPCTDRVIDAAVMGTLAMSLSGELADKENPPIGTYKTLLFDNLFLLDKETLEKYARIEEKK